MLQRYLYTFPKGSVRDHGIVNIHPNGILEDGTPVEDYGDYLLTPVPTETPFEDWCSHE